MPRVRQNGSIYPALAVYVASLALAVPLRAASFPLTQFDELHGVILRDILEDSRRNIWLAADDGLWQRGANEFRRFPAWGKTGSATALVEDRNGILWVGTPSGIIRLNPVAESVDSDARLLQRQWILCLKRDAHGIIWAGTERGLVRFDPASAAESLHTIASTEEHQVLCIAFTADGGVLAGSDGVVLHIRDQAVVKRDTDLPGKRKVRAILTSNSGDLWVGLRTAGGLGRIRDGQVRWFGADDGLLDQEVNAIVEHPDGSIYAATENGLFRFADGRFTSIGADRGLGNVDLHSLSCDREGNVWIGTYGAGVVLLRSASVLTYNMGDGLRHPVVTGAARRGDRQLVFSTIHGATVFDPASSRMQNIDPTSHLNTAHSTPTGEVLLGGPAGWCAAGDAKMARVGGEILAMDGDRDRGLWIATTRGLYFQSGEEPTRVEIPSQAGPRVNTVQAFPDGCIMGTPQGLWQLEGGEWRPILQGDDVRCVLHDEVSLWVGTSREVIEFGPDHASIRSRCTVSDVRDLARQDQDTVWAASGEGLVRFRGGSIDRFFPEDGLPTGDVRCLAFDLSGVLYAGTAQGVAQIQTDRFAPCDTPPSIVVDAVIIGGAYHTQPPDPLRIESRNADVTVRFSPRGFRSAVGVQYQFQLAGALANGRWSNPTVDPSFHAEDLAGGRYALHARCINAHGLVSDNEVVVQFSVDPPATVPPWLAATTAAITLAALIMTGLYRRRRRQAVAEREQALSLLLESESRLQAILENTTAVIYLKDGDGRYLLINRQFEVLFNVSRSEIIGRTDYDLFPRAQAEAFHRNDRLVLQSGRVLEFDEVAPHRDGPHDYLSIKFPLFNSEGKPSAVCGISTDITSRKRAEKSLRESESYNRALFQSSTIGLALCRLDGELVDVNEAYAQIIGRTTEEVLGLTYWQITPPEYADQERQMLESLLEAGRYGPYEKEYFHKDGHLVPVRLSGMILNRGDERFIWSSVEDITEQRRASDAIRENERRLRELTAAVPGAVYQFRINADGTRSFPYISDGIQSLCGVTPEQVLSDPNTLFHLVHRDDLAALEQSIIRSRETFADWLHEFRIVTAPGEEKWIRGNSVPRRVGKDVTVWTGVMVDISPLKLAQDQLRRQAMVFEHMYDGVILCDQDGRIAGWNRGAERMFGYSSDEMRGRTPEMLNRAGEAPVITERIQEALREHGQWTGEINFVRKDGAEGICEAVVVQYRDELGQPVTTISVNRDVTARKRAEQRAQQHQAELARIARFTALGEMTAGIAHQLNQPLAALRNFVRGCERRMRNDGRYAPEVIDAMEQAVQQADRAADIIRHVRSLIRQEGSSRTLVSLNTLLQHVTELAEVKSRMNGAPLRLELDPELPLVKIDAIQIEQMMLNLIGNAYDAIEQAGPGRHEVAIRTHVTREGEVAIDVCDSGVGMPTDNLEQAFEPFYSTKNEGLGIGLSISRTIAVNNGGRLVAIAPPGRGAVFRLTLPPAIGVVRDER